MYRLVWDQHLSKCHIVGNHMSWLMLYCNAGVVDTHVHPMLYCRVRFLYFTKLNRFYNHGGRHDNLQPDLIDWSNWNFLYVLICCVRDSFQMPLCWWITMSDMLIYSSRLVYLGILKTKTIAIQCIKNLSMWIALDLCTYTSCWLSP